eukprot:g763.t1
MDLATARRLAGAASAGGARGGWGFGGFADSVEAACLASAAPSRPAPAGRGAAPPFASAPGAQRLAALVARICGARHGTLNDWRALDGGAVHAHWAVDLRLRGGSGDGRLALVLRATQGASLPDSHGPPAEAALLRAARDAGISAPEALGAGHDPAILDRPFLLMARLPGRADPSRLTGLSDGAGAALAYALGGEAARLHAISPQTHPLSGLAPPAADPAAESLERLRAALDSLGAAEPALEWGLAWLDRRRPTPPSDGCRLVHRDFRTGNILLDGDRYAGLLDWEFAGWSDPHEDAGWLSAVCWRFTRRDRPVGGFAGWGRFLDGYRGAGGRPLEPARIRWWSIYALLRWAVIALQQGARHRPGDAATLDCALTPWRLPELAVEILRRTPPEGGLAGEGAS